MGQMARRESPTRGGSHERGWNSDLTVDCSFFRSLLASDVYQLLACLLLGFEHLLSFSSGDAIKVNLNLYLTLLS